jgi:release factor glutamine methyltransferase
VLIPRPESELIVEAACERRPERTGVQRIIDVGTGSGCLAVALAAEFPGARVLATDISEAALAVATRNASRHVDGRVSFLRADLLEAVIGPVDLIVSNPPYVSSVVELSPDIVRFEPPVALYSGENGLSLISRLIASAHARLASDGLFVLEFGLGQDEDVQALAKAAGWRDVRIKTDLQGIPRVAIMTK